MKCKVMVTGSLVKEVGDVKGSNSFPCQVRLRPLRRAAHLGLLRQSRELPVLRSSLPAARQARLLLHSFVLRLGPSPYGVGCSSWSGGVYWGAQGQAEVIAQTQGTPSK